MSFDCLIAMQHQFSLIIELYQVCLFVKLLQVSSTPAGGLDVGQHMTSKEEIRFWEL